MTPTRTAGPAAAQQRRGYWLRTLHQWHWISAAFSLVVLLLFTVTGITLNHAAQIEAEPRVSNHAATLPDSVLATLEGEFEDDAPLPETVRRWLQEELDVRVDARAAEWSDGEAYVSLPRPGGDAWLAIDRGTGDVEYELTTRGTIAWLNDLHKGRNTGAVWRWFIDIFAIACLLFALTGLWLLYLHSRQRGATWPLVAAGLAVPAIVVILFMH